MKNRIEQRQQKQDRRINYFDGVDKIMEDRLPESVRDMAVDMRREQRRKKSDEEEKTV